MNLYLAKHFVGKLPSTFRICYCLFMARTFGEYKHSGWNGEFEYALYVWRGKEWTIPTGANDEISAE